ncbi:MAG: TVP38/TMEM64 family protein [Pseudolabrys sp.]
MADSGEKQDATGTAPASALRRWLPVAVIAVLIAAAYAAGLHKQLTLETLVRHRAAIDTFINGHYIAALALFTGLYLVVVALSIPVSLFLTISSGILFGVVVGSAASIVGAAAGATIVFLVAKTAAGDLLARRAGPALEKLADGFRADAFSYLLFLRLVPLFPFWLVNLAPALFGVKLRTFVTATVIGILPGAAAFAFVGAGLDSVIGAQEAAFKACVASGQQGCKLNFDVRDAVTPQLLGGFVALGVVALIPIVVRRLRGRRGAETRQGA